MRTTRQREVVVLIVVVTTPFSSKAYPLIPPLRDRFDYTSKQGEDGIYFLQLCGNDRLTSSLLISTSTTAVTKNNNNHTQRHRPRTMNVFTLPSTTSRGWTTPNSSMHTEWAGKLSISSSLLNSIPNTLDEGDNSVKKIRMWLPSSTIFWLNKISWTSTIFISILLINHQLIIQFTWRVMAFQSMMNWTKSPTKMPPLELKENKWESTFLRKEYCSSHI